MESGGLLDDVLALRGGVERFLQRLHLGLLPITRLAQFVDRLFAVGDRLGAGRLGGFGFQGGGLNCSAPFLSSMRISLKLAGVPPLLERLLVPLWVAFAGSS